MSLQAEFADYLTRMLGKPIAVDQPTTLSSGQQARAAGWLRERGCNPPDLRARLRSRFSPTQLLETGVSAAVADSPKPNARASVDRTEAAQMRLRVGIDIQRTEEIVPAGLGPDLKSSAELRAIFTLREISYAQSRPSPNETLCGIFCAKEALRKCDGALLALPLTEVEVLPDPDGKPAFPGYTLTISHSGGLAVAVALADLAIHATPPPAVPQSPVPDSRAEPSGAQRTGGLAILAKLLVLAGALTALAVALQHLGLLRGVN